jgi:hypothetical protein
MTGPVAEPVGEARLNGGVRGWLRTSATRNPAERPVGEDPIFEQLDALHDERVERNDPKWFPPGPDPQGLERLVEERRARKERRKERRPWEDDDG